jgi:hypothetical protein
MAKSKRKRVPKTVMKLPDLEQSKSAVLNSFTSSSSKRSYDHAICEFIDWYCPEPRLAFNKTVVTRYRIALASPRAARTKRAAPIPGIDQKSDEAYPDFIQPKCSVAAPSAVPFTL